MVGCSQPDPIREYTVPRAPQPGALWFFKLIGPQAAVDQVSASLKDFVAGVRFDPRTGLPDWELPADWSEESQPNSVRYSTITIPGASPLQVAVTQINSLVPVPRDDLRAQSNVLREQVQLPDVLASEDVNQVAPAMSIDGHPARVFDYVGETPQHGATRLYAFMIAVPTPPANVPQSGGREFPLAYDAPAEWKEAAQTQFSLVSMSAGEGADVAAMTITPAMGDPLSNVNRWRNQAGLKSVEQTELVDIMTPIETADVMILYTEAIGETRGILGAMIPVESGQTYFVKLDGPPSRVEAEKERFRTFLDSFRMATEGAAAPRSRPSAKPAGNNPAEPPAGDETKVVPETAEKPVEEKTPESDKTEESAVPVTDSPTSVPPEVPPPATGDDPPPELDAPKPVDSPET